MKKLTDKQKKILYFISEFTSQNRMAPTVYEIADQFQIKTSTVFAHLKALQKKNYLQRSSKARSITLKKSLPRKDFSGAHSIPLQNSAGDLPDQTSEKSIFYDAEMFHYKENSMDPRNCFAMIMEENCYLSRGILPGDIAILLKTPQNLQPGDLIIVMNDGHQELLECKKILSKEIEFYNFHSGSTIYYSPESIPMEGLLIGIQRSL